MAGLARKSPPPALSFFPGEIATLHARPLLTSLVLVLCRAAAAVAEPAAACRTIVLGPDLLTEVSPLGELSFRSGLRGRLDGLRLPAEGGAAREWLGSHVGQVLRLERYGEPDRWGRALLLAGADEAVPDLAAELAGRGLALVDPGERDALCRPGLLLLEDAARRRGAGLWAAAPVLDALAADRLTAAVGRFVVAEGRIRGIGERRTRTYLNFAPWGGQGLTVMMPARTWRTLVARGWSATALRGRQVRVRGIVELWRGPTIDLVAAEGLEILDGDNAPRR